MAKTHTCPYTEEIKKVASLDKSIAVMLAKQTEHDKMFKSLEQKIEDGQIKSDLKFDKMFKEIKNLNTFKITISVAIATIASVLSFQWTVFTFFAK